MNKNKLPDVEKLYSKAAEASVLGSMIIDPMCISRVLPRLPRSDAFFLPEHRIIYDAIVKLFIANLPIDGISVRTELEERGKLDEVGGDDYVIRVMESVPTSANAVHYAGIVRAKEAERKVRVAAEQIAEIPDEPGSVDEMIQKIQSLALELEPTKSGPDFVELCKVANETAVAMRDGMGDAIPTGYRDIDRLIHGFYPGEFVIMAGRPSMGKSALAFDTALNIDKAGTRVFFSTLEMPWRQLVERGICSLAAVDICRIRAGEANESEYGDIYQQALNLQDKSRIILSTYGETPEQLAALVHRLKQTHDIKIMFVDYLQLMRTAGRSESRQQEITEISRKLKALALRENIPVVALSQLNRKADDREEHRPRMSDLRESGSLEQDADLIMLLYREDYYNRDNPGYEPNGITEVIVSKNRRGRTGVVKLVFVGEYVRFSNLSEL